MKLEKESNKRGSLLGNSRPEAYQSRQEVELRDPGRSSLPHCVTMNCKILRSAAMVCLDKYVKSRASLFSGIPVDYYDWLP